MERVKSETLKQRCRDAGFMEVGICSARDADTYIAFGEWIEQHFHGQMRYLSDHRAQKRRGVQTLNPEFKTVVCVLWPYAESNLNHPIAAYARNTSDYHTAITTRLSAILTSLCLDGIVFSDTHPILEREHAQRAGLGWIGKNTCLISREKGSLFLLGGMAITQAVDVYDQPMTKSFCGTCTRCIEKCPTGAFVKPHVLDARRCISYLTIEYRGVIEAQFIPHLKGHFFGCDICQAVCPWNQKHMKSVATDDFDPLTWLHMSKTEFRQTVSGTALSRMRYDMMQRNALIQVFHAYGLHRTEIELEKVINKSALVLEQVRIFLNTSIDGVCS